MLLLVAAALTPVTLLAITGLLALGRQQHALAQQGMLERVRAFASAVDLEHYNSVEALKVLALSRSLDTGDLRRFHADAGAAAKARSDWAGILLVDPSGKWLVNSARPFGERAGTSVVEKESFDVVLVTRRPAIGGLAKGPGGQYRFPVRVPVVRDGELRYVLTAFVKADLLQDIVVRQKVPGESVTTIFDGSFVVVARSRNHEQYLGTPVSQSLARMMTGETEGGGSGTTLEGQAVYTAFARSTRSSWGAALGVSQELVDAPIRRSYLLSAAGLLLSLVLGVSIAAWLARRIAGQLERSRAELEAANRELEAFSYSVSHDLRAPLRAIDGFSTMLAQDHGDALPAEGRRYLDTVSAKAKQMGRLIDDLLGLARIGRQELARRRVDMRKLAVECVDKLRADAGGKAPGVTVGDLPACDGEPALLRQVLLNLVGNAFKYSAKTEGARVEVGAERREGELAYYVRDNGAGFDMKYAARLFGVFQRLHRGDEFEGTGVGLAIVQRVVHRHGGRVWAHGEPGRGATFYFTIPPSAR
jgi:signal transduction histidine kinase